MYTRRMSTGCSITLVDTFPVFIKNLLLSYVFQTLTHNAICLLLVTVQNSAVEIFRKTKTVVCLHFCSKHFLLLLLFFFLSSSQDHRDTERPIGEHKNLNLRNGYDRLKNVVSY